MAMGRRYGKIEEDYHAPLQRGRESNFCCAAAFSVRFGKGSRLILRLVECPSEVPGRVGLVGLSLLSWLYETLRLNEEPTPAKL